MWNDIFGEEREPQVYGDWKEGRDKLENEVGKVTGQHGRIYGNK